MDLVSSEYMWLENAEDIPKENVVNSTRIGIESAGAEVANKRYRFYELDNQHVSVRDKSSESEMRMNIRDA